MDIKKLKQIADRHELDIIDKNECLLLNSYKNQDKYKIFSVENKETQKNFYIEFINELIKNVRSKDLFNNIIEDTKGYKDLFLDLGYLSEQYGNLFKGD